MKSRFSDIVKIRQLKVDSIEREIQKEYSDIEKLKKIISQIESNIIDSNPPISGNFSFMQQFHIGLRNMNLEIQKYKNHISQHLHNIENLKEHLKQANIELEKYKYLHNDEVKKVKLELNRKEQKYLDELAVLRFSFKKN
jgi:flagellar export protein FliJ